MPLRDLIPALTAHNGSARALLKRVDPVIIDELRAYAVHRQIDLMNLAAECLVQLATDAADTVWQIGIERHSTFENDPEAALLGNILLKAVRSRLQRESQIGSTEIVQMIIVGFNRCGHPYPMA
jgi:hypothetical protein